MRAAPVRASRLACLTACLSLVLLVCPAARGQQAGAGLPADKVSRIEAAITSFMARHNAPALSVAVVADGQPRLIRGYGMADMEHFAPAKASTVYRLASVSKPITAVAVMQLAERGKIDLDAPVQKYCPAFPPKQWTVTTRQLLGHTGGVRHYRGNENDSTRHYAGLTDALAIFKDDPLLHEPGTRSSYTTYGYTVLGCVVEGASGQSFMDYLREHVFRPARMDTACADSVYAIIPNRARGYGKFPDGRLRHHALDDTSYKIPGGGLCASAEDLARFAVAAQDGTLVRTETFAQMATAQRTRAGEATGYGLGWFVGGREGREGSVWHGGAQQGATTDLYLLPKEKFALALLTNLEGGGRLGLAALASQIADIVLQ